MFYAALSNAEAMQSCNNKKMAKSRWPYEAKEQRNVCSTLSSPLHLFISRESSKWRQQETKTKWGSQTKIQWMRKVREWEWARRRERREIKRILNGYQQWRRWEQMSNGWRDTQENEFCVRPHLSRTSMHVKVTLEGKSQCVCGVCLWEKEADRASPSLINPHQHLVNKPELPSLHQKAPHKHTHTHTRGDGPCILIIAPD